MSLPSVGISYHMSSVMAQVLYKSMLQPDFVILVADQGFVHSKCPTRNEKHRGEREGVRKKSLITSKTEITDSDQHYYSLLIKICAHLTRPSVDRASARHVFCMCYQYGLYWVTCPRIHCKAICKVMLKGWCDNLWWLLPKFIGECDRGFPWRKVSFVSNNLPQSVL